MSSPYYSGSILRVRTYSSCLSTVFRNHTITFLLGNLSKFLFDRTSICRSPMLQVLSIKSCPNVTDLSITKIASTCSMLRVLDISYCYEISHKSLELIGRGCPNLKVLKRNLMNWLDPSQHSGIVPDEYLNACPQDGDREAITISSFMHNLEHLELRFSKMTGDGLERISNGCGNLEHLDLFGCANLTSRAMERASAKLKNLKKLVRPNFYIPRALFHTERYGHWRLYDDRFQTGAFFQIWSTVKSMQLWFIYLQSSIFTTGSECWSIYLRFLYLILLLLQSEIVVCIMLLL